MDGQHDQEASPGYVGPQGVPDTSDEDTGTQSTLSKIGEGIADAFTGDDVAQAAERTPTDLPETMDLHEERVIGMATADVENNPYQGSAGSQALDMVKDEEPDLGDVGIST